MIKNKLREIAEEVAKWPTWMREAACTARAFPQSVDSEVDIPNATTEGSGKGGNLWTTNSKD